MATATWNGNAMTQTDMMEKDTVLVLDDKDNLIGSASKLASHEFNEKQPRGILHRAFSVFVFDESTGEMLLQKRASTKITFPNVRRSFHARKLGTVIATAFKYKKTFSADNKTP
jgi:isopentenyl-diphosphate delta-isomerase